MAKVCIITDRELEDLLLRIDRDPLHGYNGGSSAAQVRDKVRDEALQEAHRFYNYQIRRWIDEVKG